MTPKELFRWANHHNYEDLPLYLADDSKNMGYYDEVEVSGMKFHEAEDDGEFSECCGASMTGEMVDVGICPDCKEHCESIEGLPKRIFLKI